MDDGVQRTALVPSCCCLKIRVSSATGSGATCLGAANSSQSITEVVVEAELSVLIGELRTLNTHHSLSLGLHMLRGFYH